MGTTQDHQNPFQWFRCVFFNHCPLWPSMVTMLIVTNSWGCYITAVLLGQINPVWPTISDVGSQPPQSAIYAMVGYLVTILFLMTIFAVYHQTKFTIEKYTMGQGHQDSNGNDAESRTKLATLLVKGNQWTMVCGCIAALLVPTTGLISYNDYYTMHTCCITVMSSFFFLYAFFMVIMVYQCRKMGSPESPPLTIIVIVLTTALYGLVFYVTSTWAGYEFGWERTTNNQRRRHWSSSDPGYWLHVVANVTEWMLFTGFALFFACLANRMRLFVRRNGRDWWRTMVVKVEENGNGKQEMTNFGGVDDFKPDLP